jgi:hypothetical protein
MARDPNLETWLRAALRDEPGVSEKAMFGGLAWLLNGNLLCGARHDGMLARVGPARDAWALALPNVGPMISGDRAMGGWVRAGPAADEETRSALLAAALAFARALPPKREGGAKPKPRWGAGR